MAWLKDKNRAVAQEIGFDLRLAAQIARFADRRGKRFWRTYAGIFVVSTLLSVVAPGAGLAGVVAAAIVWARRSIEERNTFAPMFWPGRFRPEEIAQRFPADLTGEELESLPANDQNLFVYGGFSPFVGAGHDLGGWSVAIALDKAKEHFGSSSAIRGFVIPELYEAIDAGLDGLQVRGIEKKDCFFVRGTDIRGEKAMLPDLFGRPVQCIEPEVAERYMFQDDEKVRHYRCYRIVDWGANWRFRTFCAVPAAATRCSSRQRDIC